MKRSQEILPTALLILLAFFIRAHSIQALPPFNDESLHIRRAEIIYKFTDRNLNMTLGKLLSYYWIGLFHPARLDAIFVGRTASALFALLGLAAAYSTARILFGRVGGWITLILAAFSPFLIFFDRLALSDGLTAALGMLVIWASLLMMRRANYGKRCPLAILAGFLSGLVIVSKLLGLPMAGVPLVAVFTLNHTKIRRINFQTLWQILRTHRDQLMTAYVTFGLVMLPFIWHIVDRTITGKYVNVVNNNLINGAAEEKSPPQVLIDNLHSLWSANWVLHGSFLWIMMLAGVAFLLWKRPREGSYLILSTVLAWSMSVVFAADLSTRYLTLGVLPSLVIVAGAISLAIQEIAKINIEKPALHVTMPERGAIAVLLVWLVWIPLPFINHAWNDPTKLHLPQADQWEYFGNFGSGYGLIAAAHDMETLPRSEPSGRVQVIGLVGSCHQIRLYLDEYGPVKLECPFFGWQGEFMQDVANLVDQRVAEESTVYLLVEPKLRFTDLSMLHVRWELIHSYPRPFNGMTVELWRAYPNK
ncbi:MAG: glycosyltransferase family 39 protein [Chloroflexi bacterium]|nr:glycosyltransferase family 39 protein [Chloroflexota bacterium]